MDGSQKFYFSNSSLNNIFNHTNCYQIYLQEDMMNEPNIIKMLFCNISKNKTKWDSTEK